MTLLLCTLCQDARTLLQLFMLLLCCNNNNNNNNNKTLNHNVQLIMSQIKCFHF